MRPLHAAIEVRAPADGKRVHLSVPPATLTSSNVSGVGPGPQGNEEITAPRQLGVAAEAGARRSMPTAQTEMVKAPYWVIHST